MLPLAYVGASWPVEPLTLYLFDFICTSLRDCLSPDVCRRRPETSLLKMALELLQGLEISKPSTIVYFCWCLPLDYAGVSWPEDPLTLYYWSPTFTSCRDCSLQNLCRGRSGTSSLKTALESLSQPKSSKPSKIMNFYLFVQAGNLKQVNLLTLHHWGFIRPSHKNCLEPDLC